MFSIESKSLHAVSKTMPKSTWKMSKVCCSISAAPQYKECHRIVQACFGWLLKIKKYSLTFPAHFEHKGNVVLAIYVWTNSPWPVEQIWLYAILTSKKSFWWKLGSTCVVFPIKPVIFFHIIDFNVTTLGKWRLLRDPLQIAAKKCLLCVSPPFKL